MGVHAGKLALKSDLRLVQEYRRSLLPCLEQARRPTLDHHVYRSSGLGVWVLISENWYNIGSLYRSTPVGSVIKEVEKKRTVKDLSPEDEGCTADDNETDGTARGECAQADLEPLSERGREAGEP